MKTPLVLTLALTGLAIIAAAQTTNNLTVVLDHGQDTVLRAAWVYDNQLRTNGTVPYTSPVGAQTFKQFAETLASESLMRRIEQIKQERETTMILLWRDAGVIKQNAALRALQ